IQVRIIEGDKERIQSLTGTVIARKGSGISETFSIYRVAYGVSMERVFPLHSPRIAKIEVLRKGKTRRSKLYFLRGIQGKKARITERIMSSAKKGKISAIVADEETVDHAPEMHATDHEVEPKMAEPKEGEEPNKNDE
ncbi:MAG: 50S ribosomal protein L19, partial [Chlamydiia bacterium]|nr:50S ribosomal protein L19 [Chlamydiia bacterium]